MTRASLTATPLAAVLAERIRQHGPITFAEYMEACLYHPQYGYYTKQAQQPVRDYFTSADVKPLFGRLLARQWHEMWKLLGQPNPFWLVEAGAGTGALSKAILDFARDGLPDFHACLRYVAVERSEPRRAAQLPLLAEHIRRGRFHSTATLPLEIPVGCIFSNELLDALPVHRVMQVRDSLEESYVVVRDSQFAPESGPLSTPRITDYFAKQEIALRDGQQAEVCLAACDWIRDAAVRLGHGFVVTIDYGREARELYDQRHMRGTLLAYRNHQASEDFFCAPGDQDLTAHVNFTALDLWGRPRGLARRGVAAQANFLLSLAHQSNYADLELPESAATERDRTGQRLLFKTLINPEGLGETFQVLIQHKGIETPALTGLRPL
jgi:SAM-dependent MidA family methyltransferase